MTKFGISGLGWSSANNLIQKPTTLMSAINKASPGLRLIKKNECYNYI